MYRKSVNFTRKERKLRIYFAHNTFPYEEDAYE